MAPAQGVQKPAHRSKSGEGQARLDKEAARHNKAEANADSFVKRLKAKAKKRNAAAGLSRMVRGMCLGARAEAKTLKELQDNEAAAEAEEAAAAAQEAEDDVSCAELFDPEEEADDADQPEWAAEVLGRAQPEE